MRLFFKTVDVAVVVDVDVIVSVNVIGSFLVAAPPRCASMLRIVNNPSLRAGALPLRVRCGSAGRGLRCKFFSVLAGLDLGLFDAQQRQRRKWEDQDGEQAGGDQRCGCSLADLAER